MLKARVLTALVMLPIALLILFVLPEDAFALCVGLIILVGAWEWIRLSGLMSHLLTLTLLVVFSGVLYWSYLLPSVYVPMLLGIGCIFWIGAAAMVMMYPRSKEQVGGKYMKLGFGLLVLMDNFFPWLIHDVIGIGN